MGSGLKTYTLRHYYNGECYEVVAFSVEIERGQYLFFGYDQEEKKCFTQSFSTRGWDIIDVVTNESA